MAYNENHLIRYDGKVVAIKEVPATYLIKWFDKRGGNNYQGHERKLKEWIYKNYTILQNKAHEEEKQAEVNIVVKYDCVKVTYLNKKDANRALKTISESNRRNTKGKKPIRSYECPHCGFWHLTSKKLIKL